MSDGLLTPTSDCEGVARSVAHLRVSCAMIEFGKLTTESVGVQGIGLNDCKGGTILRSIYSSRVWHCDCF